MRAYEIKDKARRLLDDARHALAGKRINKRIIVGAAAGLVLLVSLIVILASMGGAPPAYISAEQTSITFENLARARLRLVVSPSGESKPPQGFAERSGPRDARDAVLLGPDDVDSYILDDAGRSGRGAIDFEVEAVAWDAPDDARGTTRSFTARFRRQKNNLISFAGTADDLRIEAGEGVEITPR